MNDDKREGGGSLPDFALWSAQFAAAVFGVPEVGVLLGGTAAMGLARVRSMRLQEFGESVHARLGRIEADIDQLRERLAGDESRAELLEHAAEAAARTASKERREYLAELVARGLTTEERSADEVKKLLYMLNDLADSEVIWLVHLSHDLALGERTEHYTRHEETLKLASREVGIARTERDRAAFQQGYVRNLERLGLISSGAIPGQGSISITGIGRILLRYIGADSNDKETGK